MMASFMSLARSWSRYVRRFAMCPLGANFFEKRPRRLLDGRMLDGLTLGTGALQNVVDHPEATASLLRDISRSAFSAGRLPTVFGGKLQWGSRRIPWPSSVS